MFKFNINSAARSKLGPAGNGGALQNSNDKVIFMYYKNVGGCNYSEVEVLAILKFFEKFREYPHCGERFF